MLELLGRNEDILLMYLADELPPDDRADVERMLANDAALRAQLEELRVVDDVTKQLLVRADNSASLDITQVAVLRRVSRAMHQRIMEKSVAPEPTVADKPTLRYPWWVYPSSAIAASILAFLVWWDFNGSVPNSTLGVTDDNPAYVADAVIDSFEVERQFAATPVPPWAIDEWNPQEAGEPEEQRAASDESHQYALLEPDRDGDDMPLDSLSRIIMDAQ